MLFQKGDLLYWTKTANACYSCVRRPLLPRRSFQWRLNSIPGLAIKKLSNTGKNPFPFLEPQLLFKKGGMFKFLNSGIFCQLNSIQKPNTQFYIRDAYTCLCGIGGKPGRSITPSPPGITPEAPLLRALGNRLIHL